MISVVHLLLWSVYKKILTRRILQNMTKYLKRKGIVTVRNEVAKVMFLHLSVILFTGGSTWAGPPGTRYTPPGMYSPGQVPPPLGPGTPTRQVHRPDQVHPLGRYPPTRYTPQLTATVADGMHPSGMHSCS